MKQFKKLASYFNQIKITQGSKAKMTIFNTMMNDSSFSKEDLAKILTHLFGPNVITGIAKTSWLKEWKNRDHSFLRDVIDIVDYISTHNSGKDKTIETLKSLEKTLETEKDKLFLYYLVTRDIQIGLNTQSIQKKFNLFDKFEIQLGSGRPEKLDLTKSFYLTQKLDGVNLTVIKENDKITFYTRNGKTVDNLNILKQEYLILPDGVYCGEALYDGELKDRNELYRQTVSELHTDKEDKKIIHNLFDYTTLEEWKEKKANLTYDEVYDFLKDLTNSDSIPHIKVVDSIFHGICNEQELDQKILEVKNKNWEGLMLRYDDSRYEWKRSKNLIKLKPFYTIDLRVTGYGEHKNGDMLGQLSVDYYGETVWVGSGYTKEERKDFWLKREDLIGKIIEVQFMEETQNKDGKKSLRFPVFKRLRLDKNEESYN